MTVRHLILEGGQDSGTVIHLVYWREDIRLWDTFSAGVIKDIRLCDSDTSIVPEEGHKTL